MDKTKTQPQGLDPFSIFWPIASIFISVIFIVSESDNFIWSINMKIIAFLVVITMTPVKIQIELIMIELLAPFIALFLVLMIYSWFSRFIKKRHHIKRYVLRRGLRTTIRPRLYQITGINRSIA